MSSYVQKDRAAQEVFSREQSDLAGFLATLDFDLDDFQLKACRIVERDRSILVAAPTGAGKTLVGEYAIFLALHRGKKVFYTTPIKALSNQKYHDLVDRYGQEQVGLLTGDSSINPEAAIVVMTTEVLRNMLYADSPALLNLAWVIMDEVHYLADRFRGAVWEEVIIHLPEHINIVALSATISNAEEFGAWLDTVRGQTDVIVSEVRPVPLWQHMLVGKQLYDLFADCPPNQEPPINKSLLTAVAGGTNRARHSPYRRKRSGREHARQISGASRAHPKQGAGTTVARPALVTRLDRAALLPAIYFIFSRAGCDAAVLQCLDANLRLTTPTERSHIQEYIQQATLGLEAKDLSVLGFYEWREGLLRGIAAHHAGLLPTFKEIVEELFSRGLVKIVFATETLALGINMPARSVVLEKMTKFNGQSHVDITAGEYTQLTGRAGRRGIDVEGHAVVVWRPGLEPEYVAGLAAKRSYPLNSSFRPTYNMSANLVAQFGVEHTKKILESSFAQFQADKSVVGLAQRVRKNENALRGYAQSMDCHLGDFTAYTQLTRRLAELEKKAGKRHRRLELSQALASLQQLRAGDIIDIPAGKYRGLALVLSSSEHQQEPRPAILTAAAQLRRLTLQDLEGPILPLSYVKVPKKFQAKTPKDRRDMAARMRQAVRDHRPARRRARNFSLPQKDFYGKEEISNIRKKIQEHPCHACAELEDHNRWAARWWKLKGETDGLRRQIDRRTNTIAQVFERICSLLTSYGYLAQDSEGKVELTARGQGLRKIYGEKDLLLSLCLEQNLLAGADPAAAAAIVSAVVYQPKRAEGLLDLNPYPHARVEAALAVIINQWRQLCAAELDLKLTATAAPDLGMVWPIYRWARGCSLAQALEDSELAAGDFVRWVKQVIDALEQISHAAHDRADLITLCQAATGLLRRGVVSSQI